MEVTKAELNPHTGERTLRVLAFLQCYMARGSELRAPTRHVLRIWNATFAMTLVNLSDARASYIRCFAKCKGDFVLKVFEGVCGLRSLPRMSLTE